MPVRFGVKPPCVSPPSCTRSPFCRCFHSTDLFPEPGVLGFAAAIGILLVVEHRLVKPQDLTRIDIAFYHVNSIISVLIFLALVAEELMRRVFF